VGCSRHKSYPGYRAPRTRLERIGDRFRFAGKVARAAVAGNAAASTRDASITTLTELRDEFIEEDIDRLIGKIDELDEDIRDFRDGHLRYGDIDPKTIRRIFPIAVTSFSAPHWVGIISRIRVAIEENGWLHATEPLEIVEIQVTKFNTGEDTRRSGESAASNHKMQVRQS
jgi:hypothetical protein